MPLLLFLKRNRAFAIWLVVFLAATTIFVGAPDLDIWLSYQFFDASQTAFLHETYPGIRFVSKELTAPFAVALFVVPLLVLVYNLLQKTDLWTMTPRRYAFLIVCMLLGPGLIVNEVFKNNWGRARPTQTTLFGGDKAFTPALLPADQCEKNCSFTSGDSSVGFFLYAFAFAFPAYAVLFFWTATGLGLAMGTLRVAAGAHFFSDVIFSALFVYLVCWLLALAFFERAATEDKASSTSDTSPPVDGLGAAAS